MIVIMTDIESVIAESEENTNQVMEDLMVQTNIPTNK